MSTNEKFVKIPNGYACTLCDKTFPRKWNAKNHLRVHEPKRKKTKCPIRKCQSTFYDIPNIRLHFSRYHPEQSLDEVLTKLKWKDEKKEYTVDMPKCGICSKRFKRKENLAYHLQSYHSKNRSAADCNKDDERVFRRIRHNKYSASQKSVLKKDLSKCNCIDGECGDECINRLLLCECDSLCSQNCTNRTIQTSNPDSFEVYITRDKGWGVKAKEHIKSGSFIIQYVGEIVSENEFKSRIETQYASDAHHYGVYLESGFIIDARDMGNESRFINHSCSPNCEVQKWMVNGLPCIAIFSVRDILQGEELTIDYKFHLYNNLEEKACKCNAKNCSGVFGKKVSTKAKILYFDMYAGRKSI